MNKTQLNFIRVIRAVGGVLWLSLGNLNNGVGNAGVSCANANNALSNGRWNILARIPERNVSWTKRNAEPTTAFAQSQICAARIILALAKISLNKHLSGYDQLRTLIRIGINVGLVVHPNVPVTHRKVAIVKYEELLQD